MLHKTLGVFAGLFAVLFVPLGLAPVTSWMIIPAHFTFTLLTVAGMSLAGLSGRKNAVPWWLWGYLVATALASFGLELGASARSSGVGYWIISWTGMLLWAWIPISLSFIFGPLANYRHRRLSRKSVKERKDSTGPSSH